MSFTKRMLSWFYEGNVKLIFLWLCEEYNAQSRLHYLKSHKLCFDASQILNLRVPHRHHLSIFRVMVCHLYGVKALYELVSSSCTLVSSKKKTVILKSMSSIKFPKCIQMCNLQDLYEWLISCYLRNENVEICMFGINVLQFLWLSIIQK